MEFSVQLSAYYRGHELGGRRLYQNMLDQAVLADRLGFDAVSITEHHLINILLMPAPLQFAVKIAGATGRVKIMTSVIVLPLHDMRILAGQVVCADIFTDGRLLLGVGRGAFAFEMERLGVPLETSREKFDESLEVLQALLSEEEVSWDGKYYQFAPLTIMPRPATAWWPPILRAASAPEAHDHGADRKSGVAGKRVRRGVGRGGRGLLVWGGYWLYLPSHETSSSLKWVCSISRVW